MKLIFTTLLIITELLLPLFLSLICQRLSIGRGFSLNIENIPILTINYILWLAIFLFFTSIYKKHYKAIISTIVVFVFFTLLNRYKIKFLNQPLRLNDISLSRDLFEFIPSIIKYSNLKKELLLLFPAIIIFIVVIKKTITFEFKNILLRIAFLLISFEILSLAFFNPNIFNQILIKNNIDFYAWDAADNCRRYGMMLCFNYDLKFIKRTVPSNYSEEKITNIFNQLPLITPTTNSLKPNIIMVMSESFWDVTKFSNVKFSQDPIPNVRKDIKGSMVSPAFGGETANVEFEILTGLNNYFFPRNNYPYNEFINHSIPSLFTVFKKNQYQTTVIHPYSHWFYNRTNVYKYFGLDNFINLSNMSGYKTAGTFVSEESFTNEIIKQFNSTNDPQLIYAISIQNHAPYEPHRFSEKQIAINTSLDDNNKDVFQSYVEGIHLSDKYYEVLKKELIKEPKKPTILVFFGDHLPFLGPNFEIYKKLGYIPNDESLWTKNDQLKTQQTPIAVWSNFQDSLKLSTDISPAFLSNYIIDLAQIKPAYQFRFTDKVRQKVPVLTKKYSVNITDHKDLIEDYNLIQHDMLFGKQYFLQY